MRKSVALYRKEIKGNFPVFVIPIALMAVAILSKYLYLDNFYSTTQSSKLFDTVGLMASIASYLLMPLFFLYALSLEERQGTIFQLHLLPVRRRTILWYKFFAYLSYMVVWALLYSISENMSVKTRDVVEPYVTVKSIISYPELWAKSFFSAFSQDIMFVFLLMFAWGAAFTARRYRQVAGVAAFVLGWIGVFQFVMIVSNAILSLRHTFEINMGINTVNFVSSTVQYSSFFLMFYAGLRLYEKYSEL